MNKYEPPESSLNFYSYIVQANTRYILPHTPLFLFFTFYSFKNALPLRNFSLLGSLHTNDLVAVKQT